MPAPSPVEFPATWVEALDGVFEAGTERRGLDLWLRGAVRIDNRAATWVRGLVRDTPPAEVVIALRQGQLALDCNCPTGKRLRGLCEHTWAVLMEAEEHQYLPPPGATPTEETPPPAPSDRTWQRQVDGLIQRTLEQRATAPLEGEVRYLIDVLSSLDGRGLCVQVASSRLRPKGGWTQPRPLRFTLEQVSTAATPEDRRILATLAGAAWSTMYGNGGDPVRYGDAFRLNGPLPELVVPLLCATGRCFTSTLANPGELRPLAWDGGPAWEFRIELAEAAEPGRYELRGGLRRGDESRTLQEPLLLLDSGLVFFDGHAARLDHGGLFPWITRLRREPLAPLAQSDVPVLFDALLRLPVQPRLDVPADQRAVVERGEARPCLVVKPNARPGQGARLEGELWFHYADQRVRPGRRAWGLRDGDKLIARDRAAEAAAVERLRGLGVRARQGRSQDSGWELPASRLAPVVRELVADGWRVEAEGKLYRAATRTRVAVSSGIDWFDLQGSVDFDGHDVPLERVLLALRDGGGSVPLGDGRVGIVPPEWLVRYGLLARFAHADGGGALRFRASQAGLLDALLASQPGVSVDETFERARTRLRTFEGVKPLEPAPGFVGRLRPYQQEGLGWLCFLQELGLGGCLADDMGLGKTVQVLALLEARRAQRPPDAPRTSLVVAPKSLVFNWRQEAARFTPQLRVLDHVGPARPRERAAIDDFDVVLTTYGTLRRDALLLSEAPFDYAILDEAQAIKNAGSESAKAARLLKAQHRLALSGTPVENHLGELWSLFEFLNPGLLGRVSSLSAGGAELGEDGRAALVRALRPFLLRRTKQQVAADLPPKTEQTLYCELEGVQRRVYDGVRDTYRASLLARVDSDGLERSKIHVLEALLRLRQAACHAGLVDPAQAEEACAKLDTLLPNLLEVVEEGHKALVFSQFTSFLAFVRRRLDAEGVVYEYLDGRTRDRGARVERFQNDPDCRIFLVSLKAGGLGLNLTAAEYVFLLDPWWNPAVEAQAMDRTHRIGQTRPVFAYRVIAKDTVEEKVLQLQEGKRELAEAIVSADESLIRKLTREDLELLLS